MPWTGEKPRSSPKRSDGKGKLHFKGKRNQDQIEIKNHLKDYYNELVISFFFWIKGVDTAKLGGGNTSVPANESAS